VGCRKDSSLSWQTFVRLGEGVSLELGRERVVPPKMCLFYRTFMSLYTRAYFCELHSPLRSRSTTYSDRCAQCPDNVRRIHYLLFSQTTTIDGIENIDVQYPGAQSLAVREGMQLCCHQPNYERSVVAVGSQIISLSFSFSHNPLAPADSWVCAAHCIDTM